MNRIIKWLLGAGFCLPIILFANPVHEYTLQNGLKLLVKEDHRAPVVVSEVWYKVGASYEPLGITGISHALEHMMFKGTQTVKKGEFSREISSVGGMDNAMTSRDFTAYYEVLGSKHLPLSFRLESDRMQNLVMSPEEFAKEIKVVMEERRMRTEDNPQALTLERFYASVFMSTPYHHPVVGWMQDLKSMKVSDLQHWYQQWYVPNNATLVVVGDVQPEAVHQLAKKHFGQLASRDLPKPLVEPVQKQVGEKIIKVNVPAKLPWLIMGYIAPSIKTAKVEWEPYALEVAAAVLSSGSSSRLQSELVRGNEIATEAAGDYSPVLRLDSTFVLAGTPAQGHTLDELQAAFKAQVARLRNGTISDLELKRVKTQVIADKVYAKDSMSYQAFELGNFVTVGLPWQLSEQYVDKIKSVTAEQVQAVAKKYLISDRLTIARLIPKALTPVKKSKPQKG